jgi:lipoprotein NlpI
LAVWAFRQNVELYPNSANVYDSLGDGLLAAGDTTAAIAQFHRAIEVGTRNRDPVIGETLRKLNELESSQRKSTAP